MQADYPRAFDEIGDWSLSRRVSIAEGRIRFAQYGVLLAISGSRPLSRLLVFKGGNALDFVWQPNRSTVDLDFSVSANPGDPELDEDNLRQRFSRALIVAESTLGTRLKTQKVRRNPPRPEHTFATWQVSVGYALQDEANLIQRMARGADSSQIVNLDISLNEEICEVDEINVGGSHPLLTCTLEDIIAEKLRALLQQPIRNRNRAQDLLDVAVCVSGDRPIDRAKVGEFLLRKANARVVPVSEAAFVSDPVLERARQDYAALSASTRVMFIPFDDAVLILRQFVATLAIPAE